MIVRFWAVSRHRSSLRETLNNFIERKQGLDPGEFPITLGREKKAGRSPGWAKAYSRNGFYGVVNYEWNPRARILECQAQSRGRAICDGLVGEFVSVLLSLPGHPVKSIHIEAE